MKNKQCTINFLNFLIKKKAWNEKYKLWVQEKAISNQKNRENLVKFVEDQLNETNPHLIYDDNDNFEKIYDKLCNNEGLEYSIDSLLKIASRMYDENDMLTDDKERIISLSLLMAIKKKDMTAYKITGILKDKYFSNFFFFTIFFFIC